LNTSQEKIVTVKEPDFIRLKRDFDQSEVVILAQHKDGHVELLVPEGVAVVPEEPSSIQDSSTIQSSINICCKDDRKGYWIIAAGHRWCYTFDLPCT
jgi:hypothetical protein